MNPRVTYVNCSCVSFRRITYLALQSTERYYAEEKKVDERGVLRLWLNWSRVERKRFIVSE